MALSLARRKLQYSAFIEFNRHLLEFFCDHFKNIKTWYGFNLLAIDGSTLKLFKYKEIREHFGMMKPKNGSTCPMAHISQMFDVLNKVTIDALIEPYRVGERDLLREHMLNLLPTNLLLLDRGYPAYWVFNLIIWTVKSSSVMPDLIRHDGGTFDCPVRINEHFHGAPLL